MSYSVQYLLTAKDAISPILNKIKANLDSLNRAAQNLQNIKPLSITADSSKAKATIQDLAKDLKQIQSQNINITATKSMGTAPSAGGISVGGAGNVRGLAGAAAGFVGGSAAIMGAKASLEAFMDVETAQLGLKKALDIDGAPLESYKKKLRLLSEELGVAQEQVVRTAVSYAKADSSLSADQLTKITKLNYAASKAWEADADAVTDAMQVMQAIFNIDAGGLEIMANQVDILGDKFGVLNEKYLVDFITVGAGVGKSLGLTQQQILALGTVAGEAKIIASEASNAMKNLGKDVTAPDGDAIAAYQKLGISWEKMQKMDVGDRIRAVLESLSKYSGLDKAILAQNIIGSNYDDTLLRMATNAEKFGKALDLIEEPGKISGRVISNLGLEAETARGRLNRVVESLKNVAIDGANAVVELLAGKDISTIWGGIGDNISHVWNVLTGGAEGAKTTLTVLKFAFLSVAIGVQTIVTGLTQLFNILFGVLDGIVKLFQADFKGAWESLKNGFEEAGKAGSKYIDTVGSAMAEFDADRAKRAEALINSPIETQTKQVEIIKQQTGGASVAISATNAANATQQTNSKDPAASIQGQAALQQLQAAQQINAFGSQLGVAAQKIDDASRRMGGSNQGLSVGLPGLSLGTQGR